MIAFLRHLIGWIIVAFKSREDLILENLALRQQLLVSHAKQPRRRLSAMQKLFWLVLKKVWAGWKKPLILVTPRTVVGWHRAGCRLHWKWLSRATRGGLWAKRFVRLSSEWRPRIRRGERRAST